jgi:hypothetical protein
MPQRAITGSRVPSSPPLGRQVSKDDAHIRQSHEDEPPTEAARALPPMFLSRFRDLPGLELAAGLTTGGVSQAPLGARETAPHTVATAPGFGSRWRNRANRGKRRKAQNDDCPHGAPGWRSMPFRRGPSVNQDSPCRKSGHRPRNWDSAPTSAEIKREDSASVERRGQLPRGPQWAKCGHRGKLID